MRDYLNFMISSLLLSFVFSFFSQASTEIDCETKTVFRIHDSDRKPLVVTYDTYEEAKGILTEYSKATEEYLYIDEERVCE